MRPMLKPGLRRLWRDGTTLQLGVDPRRALVLSGVEAPVAGVLDLLDGTRSRGQLLGEVAFPGRELVALLEDGGLLEDATPAPPDRHPRPTLDHERLVPDHASLSLLARAPAAARAVLGRRRVAVVRVRGGGRVGAQIAALLAAAGVGAVLVDDAGVTRPADVSPGGLRLDDVGRPRSVAAGAAIARVCRPTPTRRRPTGAPPEPDLVVLAPPGLPVADLDEALEMERSGVPHLLAGVLETTAVVGPLVVPGVGSCLTCQHLHRADRDPAWPLLATQMARRPEHGVDACDVTLAAAVAAAAAMQALAWLDAPARATEGASDGPAVPAGEATADAAGVAVGEAARDGQPATIGGSLELALPDWRWRRRTWPTHPHCPCGRHAAIGAGAAATGVGAGNAATGRPENAGGGGATKSDTTGGNTP